MHYNIFNVNLRQFSLVGRKVKSNFGSSVTTGITIHVFIFIHFPMSQYLVVTVVEISKAKKKKTKKMSGNIKMILIFPEIKTKSHHLL